MPEEERAHGTISAKTYFLFAKEGAKSYFATAIFLVFYLSVEVCILIAVNRLVMKVYSLHRAV